MPSKGVEMSLKTPVKPQPQPDRYQIFDFDPNTQPLQHPENGRIIAINRKEGQFIEALIASGYRRVEPKR